MAESYIVKGQLVPDEVVIGMLEDTIKKNPDAKGFIFDASHGRWLRRSSR